MPQGRMQIRPSLFCGSSRLWAGCKSGSIFFAAQAAFGPDANPPLPFFHLSVALFLFTPAPPDLETPSETTDRRKVDGKHQQAQGYHPEAEDGQEPQRPTHAEREPDDDAKRPRGRNRYRETPEMKSRLWIGRNAVRICQLHGPATRV